MGIRGLVIQLQDIQGVESVIHPVHPIEEYVLEIQATREPYTIVIPQKALSNNLIFQ